MTHKGRVQKLEEKIKPEEKQKLFYSTEYKNRVEFDKAKEDFRASNPESKITVIEHIGSYQDDLTGEIITRTMFDKGESKNE